MKTIFNAGMYHLNRRILNPHLREIFSNVIKAFLPKMAELQAEEINSLVKNIEEEGIAFLPQLLNAEQIEEIKIFLKDKKMFLNYDREKKLYAPEDIPQTAHVSSYLEKDILDCPHLLEVANHPLVLSIVSKLMRCKPTLSSIKVWKSYPGFDIAKDSENFHRDVDDFKFFKLFLYLTDVDEGSGPHVYVKGTHKEKEFLRIARFSDEEIKTRYADRIIKITGEKGSTIIENTFGIHKGQVAQTQGRLIFQAQYSLLPIGGYCYTPKPTNRKLNSDKYINRLFIK